MRTQVEKGVYIAVVLNGYNPKLEKTLTNHEFDGAAVAKLPDNAFFFKIKKERRYRPAESGSRIYDIMTRSP